MLAELALPEHAMLRLLPRRSASPPRGASLAAAAASPTRWAMSWSGDRQQRRKPSPHHPLPLAVVTVQNDSEVDSDASAIDPCATATSSVNRTMDDLHCGTYLAAIGLLAAARTFILQPLNLVLARKQTTAAAAGQSTMQVLRGVLSERRGLAKGCAAMVVGAAASECLYLGLYEYLRAFRPNDPVVEYGAGYGGDVGGRVVHMPLLMIAYRQMCDTQHHRKSALAIVRETRAASGLKGLFVGLGWTVVIGAQWSGAWWATYSYLKSALYAGYRHRLGVDATASPSQQLQRVESELPERWRHRLPTRVVSPTDNVVLNTLASVVTSAVTAAVFNPYLVVRARMQTFDGVGAPKLLPIARGVLKESGVRGFWAGTVLSAWSCVIDGVLSSSSYEYAKEVADRNRGWKA